jgi:hypothetical protein
MPSVFKIAKEISRRELERHQRRIIGITASSPHWKDQNGVNEWVCDVRIGRQEEQGLIRDVLIAQWVSGVVNDLNVPVVLERSEAGRLTIIARSEIRLPDISLRTFSYAQLDMLYLTPFVEVDDVWYDGFGHVVDDPTAVTGTATTWTWVQAVDELDEVDDETPLEKVTARWEAS